MPKILPGTRVQRHEVAIGIPAEHYSSCGCEAASIGRCKVLKLPLPFAREWVESPQGSPGFLAARRHIHASQKIVTFVVFLRRVGEYVALLGCGDIEETGLWAVGRGK